MVAFDRPTQKTSRRFELKFVHGESLLLKHFRSRIEEERELQNMANATGIEDKELLRRMRNLGLDSESVVAMKFFPIAMVAWASGTVTEAERQNAEQAILSSDLIGNGKAIEQFRLWLVEKPCEQWWPLWEEYVQATSTAVVADLPMSKGKRIWQLAQRVAVASGGVWGFGAICAAEQRILKRIKQTYALS
jgi:hypothetical protein